jgi:hypothetical protein
MALKVTNSSTFQLSQLQDALYKLTGIHFTTSPVVDVEQFDKLIGKVKDL